MSKILEKNEVLTLGFGNQMLNGQPYNHTGIDIVGEGMTACHVKALMSGHVVDKGYQANGYGNYIVIDHENGYESRYAHLADPADVNVGDHVEEGQIFGYMGDTGYAFGVHLHFEIISGALGFTVIDPTDYIFGNAKLPDNKPQPQPEPVRKSNEEIAAEVCRGLWGDGEARYIALTNAGYDYNAIQAIITGTSEITYTVQPGDTLSEIGMRFGKDYHEIAAKNGIENPDYIQVGQVIKI